MLWRSKRAYQWFIYMYLFILANWVENNIDLMLVFRVVIHTFCMAVLMFFYTIYLYGFIYMYLCIYVFMYLFYLFIYFIFYFIYLFYLFY
jgi:hypothetical protein